MAAVGASRVGIRESGDARSESADCALYCAYNSVVDGTIVVLLASDFTANDPRVRA